MVKNLTRGKGFHDPLELGIIQQATGARTTIGEPTPPAVSLTILNPKSGKPWTGRPAP